MHQEIQTITLPALCASTVSFRFATGLVLSFNVSDCDDSSHMFRRFWRRFSDVVICSISIVNAGVRCRVWNTFVVVVVVVWANVSVVAKRPHMMTQTTSSSTELKRV